MAGLEALGPFIFPVSGKKEKGRDHKTPTKMLQHDPLPPKIPIAMVPSRPGRGELGLLTLLQAALHPLATLPTASPSAGSATRTPPEVGSRWWTEPTAAISRGTWR